MNNWGGNALRSFFFIVGADAHISPHDVCYSVRCGHRTPHAFLFLLASLCLSSWANEVRRRISKFFYSRGGSLRPPENSCFTGGHGSHPLQFFIYAIFKPWGKDLSFPCVSLLYRRGWCPHQPAWCMLYGTMWASYPTCVSFFACITMFVVLSEWSETKDLKIFL